MLKAGVFLTLIAAVLTLSRVPPHEQYRGHRVYRVVPSLEKHLNFLRALFEREVLDGEFWTEPRGLGDSVDIRVSPEHGDALVAALADQQIKHELIVNDLEQAIRDNYVDNMRSRHNRLRGDTFHQYMEYDEMMQWLSDRAADCGERCKLFSIGQTYEGRDMMVIKVTDGSGDSSKPGLWIDAGIHAREWIAFAMGCWFIDQLVDNEDVDKILTNYDVYVLPAINADGYVYTHTQDRTWRKSRKPNNNSVCKGTDINRNFDHMWATVGVSTDPCSDIWPGDEAFSEPESAAVARFIEETVPAGGWTLFLTLHSYSQLWMAPWGYTTDKPANIANLTIAGQTAVEALTAVHGTKYLFGSASSILYASSGTSRDWAYGVPGIEYVYTIELRDEGEYGFLLPADQIVPSGEETWAAFKALIAAIDDIKAGTA